jgi:hypothetical protein
MNFLNEISREVRRNVDGVRGYCDSCKEVSRNSNLPYAGNIVPYAFAPVLFTLGVLEPFVEVPVRRMYKAVKKKG